MPSVQIHRLKLCVALGALFLVAACGIVGPKLDFYDSSVAAKEPDSATISGSKTITTKPLSPFLVFLDSIDKKVTGRAKTARCNFNTPYLIAPGPHELLVVVSVGEPYAYSRFGVATLSISAAPKSRLVLQGEAYSDMTAAIWVSDSAGNQITEKQPVTLKDNPAKGMPIGFAAIDDACSLP